MKTILNMITFGAAGGILASAGIYWNTHWQFYVIIGLMTTVQLVNNTDWKNI